MTFKELKLSKNYEELSRYYYIFNMLSSEVFKLIEKEVEPLEISDSSFFPTLLPRSFKAYKEDKDKTLIRCMFKYRNILEETSKVDEIPAREVDELEWKDCSKVIIDFSPEFYKKVNIKERVDEKYKVVDYFFELKEGSSVGDLRVKQVLKEKEGMIDPDDISLNKEACEKVYDKIMEFEEDK